MVSVSTLGQPGWQLTSPSSNGFPIGYCTAGHGNYTPFEQFEAIYKPTGTSNAPAKTPTHRQWPMRGLAFASDLGLVGYLVKQPILGSIGWLIALPYYAYALLKQPDKQSRKEEFLFQVTANGLLPLAEAKAGIMTGNLGYQKLSALLVQKYPTSVLSKLTQPMYKAIGGLLALLVLTPTLGDPISHWMMVQYQSRYRRA